MYTIVLVVHIITCLCLILVVLIQSGRGGSLGSIFGGSGTDQLFSAPSGTAFLRKTTAILAVIFGITALTLTFFAYRESARTVTSRISTPPAQQGPATQ